jgi:hypothetical protein
MGPVYSRTRAEGYEIAQAMRDFVASRQFSRFADCLGDPSSRPKPWHVNEKILILPLDHCGFRTVPILAQSRASDHERKTQ